MSARWYGSKWQGATLGLLATGAGLATAELLVGLFEGTASPVVPVGQVFIDQVPPWLKDWAIDTFGTNDKAVLVAGALLVIFGLGIVVGLLAMRGARAAAYALTSAIGVIGAWAVLTRPDPTLNKLLPTIIGTGVSIAVLWWLGPKPEVPPVKHGDDPTDVPVMMNIDRRRFMTGAVGVGSLAVMAGGIGRFLQQRFEVDSERASVALPQVDSPARALPANAELGVAGIDPFVTPNEDFYRIDTALVVPQVSKDSWSLRIGGMVDNELELTYDDLLAREQIERHITLSCVSNEVGGGLVGNALWQGVRLADVLDEAGLHPEATQIVSRSIDGWTCGTPTEVVMDGRDALLAVGMNGEPLPARHGYPVRMVVPGLFGYVSATKWVTQIEMVRWEDYDAYWIPRGWSKEGPVKTMARIDTPRSGARSDGEIAIGGLAWAVHRGIGEVQVRIDEGDWLGAELGGVPTDDTWTQWVYRWDTTDVEPGDHRVEVRAIDGDGEPQPEGPAPVAPNGAEGYHRVRIRVEAPSA